MKWLGAPLGAAFIALSFVLPVIEDRPSETYNPPDFAYDLADLARTPDLDGDAIWSDTEIIWDGLISPLHARILIGLGLLAIASTAWPLRRGLWIPAIVWTAAILLTIVELHFRTEIVIGWQPEPDGLVVDPRTSVAEYVYRPGLFQIAPWGWLSAFWGSLLLLATWWSDRRQPEA